MRICIFEDRHVENFIPLAATRPVYDLRSGAQSLAENIIRQVPRAKVSLHVRKELQEVAREGHAGIPVNEIPDEHVWLINGRVAANESLGAFIQKNPDTRKMLVVNDEVVAALVHREEFANMQAFFAGEFLDPVHLASYSTVPYAGSLFHYPWELVDATSENIARDFIALKSVRKIAGKIGSGVHLLGKKNIMMGKGTVVKPGAVLDAEEGPIIIGNEVTILPNAVIIGPAFVGDHSIIKIGAKIYHGTSIGPWCKVGGEVEGSVIQSYSNKQHDGFLGHSYLGSWVNLGADTNTSDLKNTYGNVHARISGKMIDTGRQFVGLTMGDHSKSGINVMFDTGTVVGVSCNIYGAGLPPKFVPSFSWGESGAFEPYDLEKSIITARKVMQRRNVELSPAYERLMVHLYAATEHERTSLGVTE
jgi:UDP-N-acetylglucosamine diphosphorylase/glucosamine-1-phosphate N-acetyltransferase